MGHQELAVAPDDVQNGVRDDERRYADEVCRLPAEPLRINRRSGIAGGRQFATVRSVPVHRDPFFASHMNDGDCYTRWADEPSDGRPASHCGPESILRVVRKSHVHERVHAV
jgi:hypothetical protein